MTGVKKEHLKLIKSRLNTKLPKFIGFSSNINIYTFQDSFKNLYLRRTPKQMLHDLLRNDFLDEPVLSLVKIVEDVDKICRMLKKANDGSSTSLFKTLAHLNNLKPRWRAKNPSKNGRSFRQNH